MIHCWPSPIRSLGTVRVGWQLRRRKAASLRELIKVQPDRGDEADARWAGQRWHRPPGRQRCRPWPAQPREKGERKRQAEVPRDRNGDADEGGLTEEIGDPFGPQVQPWQRHAKGYEGGDRDLPPTARREG